MGLESFCILGKFSIMVHRIWLMSVMVDGKYKYKYVCSAINFVLMLMTYLYYVWELINRLF